MKRAYAKSQYAKPCERYCREEYPREAEQIFQKAEAQYQEFIKDMPDLGEKGWPGMPDVLQGGDYGQAI